MPRVRQSPGDGRAESGPPVETRQATTRATRSRTRDTSAQPTSQAIPRETGSRQVFSETSTASKPEKPVTRNARKQADIAPLKAVPEDLEIAPVDGEEEVVSGLVVTDDVDKLTNQDGALQLVEYLANEDDVPGEQASERRSSASSAPSATTNRTTFSQGELQNLVPELILESLIDLDDNAKRLLNLIVPDGATPTDLKANIEKLYDPRSILSKMLNTRSKALAATQDETFGSQTYIRPDIILRCLLGDEEADIFPERWWRPDAIIYEANLANLVKDLCQMAPDDPDILEVLASLDSNFPGNFVSSFPGQGEFEGVGSSRLRSQTPLLALELRTQLAIMNMVAQEPETFEQATLAICQVFLETDGAEVPLDLLSIELYTRTWEGIPLTQQQIAPHSLKRVNELRGPFLNVGNSTSDAATAAAAARFQVQKLFPWSRFQLQLLEWAQARLKELNSYMARCGGPAEIVTGLKREVARRTNDPNAPEEEYEAQKAIEGVPRLPGTTAVPENIPSSDRLGKKSHTRKGISLLRSLREGSAKQSVSASVAKSTSPVEAASVSRYTPEDPPIYDDVPGANEEVPQPTAPMSPLKAKLDGILRNNARENKENQQAQQKKSLFDPQDNGARVEWDDTVASQDQQRSGRVQFQMPRSLLPPDEQSSSSRKHARESSVEDPSEDEGLFERDTRELSTKRRRVHSPRPSYSRPEPSGPGINERIESSGPSSLRHDGSARSSNNPTQSSAPRTSTTASQRKNPGQLIELYTAPTIPDGQNAPSLQEAENYRLANHIAKMTGRTTATKVARMRKAWTTEENNQLINLIKDYGCSWSMLKKLDMQTGNILADREQTDLRDKARNMKVDFLCSSDMVMPKNFEHIQLDKKAIMKIEERGVSYEQRLVRTRGRLQEEAEDDGDIE